MFLVIRVEYNAVGSETSVIAKCLASPFFNSLCKGSISVCVGVIIYRQIKLKKLIAKCKPL